MSGTATVAHLTLVGTFCRVAVQLSIESQSHEQKRDEAYAATSEDARGIIGVSRLQDSELSGVIGMAYALVTAAASSPDLPRADVENAERALAALRRACPELRL